MNRVQEAIDKLKRLSWIKIPYLSAIRAYLQSGDPAALKRVTPFGQQGSWWGHSLADVLRPVGQWEDVDRRMIHVLQAAGVHQYLWQWVDRQLEQEQVSENVYGAVRRELEGVGETPIAIAAQSLADLRRLISDGRPTSAGRFILSLSPDDLHAAIRKIEPGDKYSQVGMGPLAGLLTLAAPERVGQLVNDLLLPENSPDVVKPLLDRMGDTYLMQILSAFDSDTDTWNKFHVAQMLYKYNRKRFRELGVNAAKASLMGDAHTNNHGPVGIWMVEEFGAEAVPPLVEYFASNVRSANWGTQIVDAAGAKLGPAATPVLLAALDSTRDAASVLTKESSLAPYARTSRFKAEMKLRQSALQYLIALNDPAQDARIEQELRQSLAEPDGESIVNFLGLAARWRPQRLEGDIWGLMQHKSKPVRGAAARTLAKLGDAALPQARELLRHKKADVRGAAVTLLANSGTNAALSELETRLDEEPNDGVRDEMLLGLSAAWASQGRVVTRKDIETRIVKAAGKLAEPPAKWADPASLPPLYWNDGERFSRDASAYILYRQSRSTQIRADVEVAPMYGLLDRKHSGDFALAILRGFLASKQDATDRWALALAALLGDDRLVPHLVAQVRDWVDNNRGKLAEYAVQALALLGSDSALLAVDAMAIRYRSKMKNVGRAAAEAFVEAARAQGVTPEELGDRVVPWLGFEPGKPRIIEAGKSRIEVSIGLDLKLAFKDLEKNKPIKSLPKTAPKELLQEFKDLSANLREIVKSQLLRLESLLVRQRRWPAEAWRQLFLQHPLLLPFAARLVWGHYDTGGKRLGTFRALEDRTLTTNEDEPFDLPAAGLVGMVHPLELSEAERQAWQNHLADYEIEPPFSQLQRKVVHCTEEQAGQSMYRDLRGTSINAITFKGRAERLGWYRGSVCDGGGITSYHKTFPASGADVFLGVEGLYMGIDMNESITLGDVCFVKHGTVKVGSYTYDEPGNDNDPRLIALGQVPPIVFSEVMGDVQSIAGKTESDVPTAAGEPF